VSFTSVIGKRYGLGTSEVRILESLFDKEVEIDGELHLSKVDVALK